MQVVVVMGGRDGDAGVLLAIASNFGLCGKVGFNDECALWDVGLKVGGFECAFNSLAVGACQSARAELNPAIVADNNGHYMR